jgi:hypothetical protein
MIESEGAASRESKAEANSDIETVRLWLDAIDLSTKEEADWVKRGAETTKVYRAQGETGKSRDRTFNILHSNIETIVPAVYNSIPVPDVRRRYQDDDPAGNEVCDLIERAISYSVDSYDFDATLRSGVKDDELVGRGVTRVRYVPYVKDDEVTHEEVTCEHVQWRNFRRGPGRVWDDVPWIAFELFLTREQLKKLSPEHGETVNLDCEIDGFKDKNDGRNPPEVFKRARVWEIWDKDAREVLFIAESKKEAPLRREQDPLGLTGFFPMPRPLYAIETSDTLVPVVPYDIYRDQAEELERVSQRIMGLVSALKARGIYDGRLSEIGNVVQSDDNTLIPVDNAMNYVEHGLEKAISWWPIDVIASVLERLYLQRDQIKNSIYEITGISDILRGETDAAETATAQQIKSQWGSLRVQRKQAEVQRYARDLFRLKAEIIATKFSWQTITMMTGLNYPSEQEKQMAAQQAQMAQQQQQPVPPQLQELMDKPSREEVEKLLRDDALRGFRIDVESDSTIRSDMTRNQTMMTQFLTGTAEFIGAIGPAVQEGFFPAEAAVEIYSAFARNFRLGKQAEDALDSMADKAKAQADQPPKPDPKLEVEKFKAQAEQQRATMDVEVKKQEHAMKMELMQADLQAKQMEIQLKRQELEMKREEMVLDAQMAQQKAAMQTQMDQQKMAMQSQSLEMQAEASEREHALGMEATEQKHAMGLEALAAKTAAQRAAAKKPGARA